MAYIDTSMKTSNGSTKQIKVPSDRGGSDRTIYVNGNNSGYRLGNNDDFVYKISSGSKVSTASLESFVKLML